MSISSPPAPLLVMASTPLPEEFEQTVQMSRPADVSATGASAAQSTSALPASRSSASHPAIAFIMGSDPGMSGETNELLRDRLKIASLLLFGGYFAFFIRGLFSLAEQASSVSRQMLFWDHLAITLVTGFIAFRLYMNCRHVLKRLRLAELIVFGGSASFFALVTYAALEESIGRGFVQMPVPPWILLIFTYALFIPNTWRRAAVVIGVMVLIPVSIILTFRWTSLELAASSSTHQPGRNIFLESSMVLILSGITAIWGVHTIRRLRTAVYEAKRIGQYCLKQSLGSGGMGDVYLAEHVLLKRPCAIKLIKPEKAGDKQALARFEREVQATARLTHWNTVEIFDYGRSDDGTFYYVMEYLPGMSLEQLVQMNGPLPPERVIHLIAQTCDALEEAHDQHLIHRDIKPANIFAAHRGRVYDVAKLLDFGLAKPLASLQASHLTQEGTIAGSPLYMSPEQITGDPLDARSDIYSLGVVMYFLLCGRTPFEDENPMKVLIAHAHETPRPLTDINPDIPGDLAEVVMRCLEKDRDHRFPDVTALRHMLLDCTAAGRWTRARAYDWWQCKGCPHKKKLDAQVFQREQSPIEAQLATV